MKKFFKIILGFFSPFIAIWTLGCSNTIISFNANNISNINIIDGDTFQVNNNKNIRVLGIDTPEFTHNWDNKIKSQGIELYFATKAKSFVINFFKNIKNIRVESKKLDVYGRYISTVKLENKDLAIELLKNGFAIVQYISIEKNNFFYTKDSFYFYKLISAQDYAQKNKNGFWSIENLNIKKIYPNPNVKLI